MFPERSEERGLCVMGILINLKEEKIMESDFYENMKFGKTRKFLKNNHSKGEIVDIALRQNLFIAFLFEELGRDTFYGISEEMKTNSMPDPETLSNIWTMFAHH